MRTKYSAKRTLINYNELVPLIGQQSIVCVERPALEVIRKLLIDRGLWSTTYVKTYHENGYDRPTDIELEPIFSAIAEFLDETGGDMSLCNDLNVTLQGIQSVLQDLAAKDCCGGDQPGSGGAAAAGPGAATFEDDGSTTFPPEFADRPAYEAYKCQAANAIRQSIVNDMSWLETASIGTLTASALAVALLTPVPFDDLIALAGYGVALATQGLLTGAANEARTKLEGPSGNVLVCDLYDASNSTNAKTALDDWGTNNLTAVANGLYGFFTGFADTNRLFGQDAITENTEITGTEITCGNCGETEWEIVSGTGTILTDGQEFVISSVPVGANHDISIKAVDGQCDVDDCLTIVTWDPPGGAGQGWLGEGVWHWTDGDCPNDTRFVNRTVPEVNTYQANRYAVTRSIPFTMTFIITPNICP